MNSLLSAYNLSMSIDSGGVDMKNKNEIKKINQKEENKSSNIKIFKSVNILNNNFVSNNIQDNKNIKKQEAQNRNKSKKAKKIVENKNNKILKKNEFNMNINSNNLNIDFENIDKVELLLKTKFKSIKPNVDTKKNFLKASINEYDLFNFNDYTKEDNDIFIDKKEINYINNELNSKTEINKKPKKYNNIIDEKEKIKEKNNNFILNKKNFQNSSNESKNKTNFNQNKNKEVNNNILTNFDKMKLIRKFDKIKTKELNNNINTNNNNYINSKNILVPMTNFTKENNCFLNSLIQVLYNLDEFRDDLIDTIFKNVKNEVIKELCELIISYKNIQEKYKNCQNKEIEPTLSVNILRKNLNYIYGNYSKGEVGDPMETLEHILDLIHNDYLLINPTKEDDICKCPSHKSFFLDLCEIKFCKKCYKLESKSYDKNCYIFNIFISELLNKLKEKNKNYNAYKLKLFLKIKEYNEIYENPNKIKIQKCKCSNEKELLYAKKLKLSNSNNPYLIINLTWAEEFPNMIDILNMFSLLPFSDKYKNLFSIDKKDKNKESVFYIKSIILYGIYHYICIIYLNTEKKWGIIDDKTIKYIDKYYDLIDHLLKNHLMPVGLFYSKNIKDKIEESEIKSNVLTNEEYLKLYKFCEDVEKRRELKISNLTKVKGSFNETNENYLNNNLFFRSVLSLLNSSTDSDYEECMKKINSNIKEDTKNDLIKNEENNKNDINFGSHYIGDFNENNLKGGLIILSTSEDNENTKNEGE